MVMIMQRGSDYTMKFKGFYETILSRKLQRRKCLTHVGMFPHIQVLRVHHHIMAFVFMMFFCY